MKPMDDIDAILFLETGELEVYTEIGEVEFIIDKLYAGSCLNYRSFFQDDLMNVSVRCVENC